MSLVRRERRDGRGRIGRGKEGKELPSAQTACLVGQPSPFRRCTAFSQPVSKSLPVIDRRLRSLSPREIIFHLYSLACPIAGWLGGVPELGLRGRLHSSKPCAHPNVRWTTQTMQLPCCLRSCFIAISSLLDVESRQPIHRCHETRPARRQD